MYIACEAQPGCLSAVWTVPGAGGHVPAEVRVGDCCGMLRHVHSVLRHPGQGWHSVPVFSWCQHNPKMDNLKEWLTQGHVCTGKHIHIRVLDGLLFCRFLDVSFNKLTVLSNELRNLDGLSALNLSYNALGTFPDVLSCLTCLRELNLDSTGMLLLKQGSMHAMH